MKKIVLVIPCYNEEKNIPLIHAEILKHCAEYDFEIIFVDDGSRDKTAQAVKALQNEDKRVKLLSFVANRGHQTALKAGLDHAEGDYIITLDADLQHPPKYIPSMIARAEEGYDCVHMVRGQLQKGIMKNFFSRNFYLFFSWLSKVDIVPGASDYRLISRRILEVIKLLPERKLFLRGLIPYLGFKSCQMEYELGKRAKGVPSYTFSKSLQMGKDALFNYTTFPYVLFFRLGLFVAFLSALYGVIIVLLKIFTHYNVPGYTDIVASVLFLGSLNLILIAVIGKYLQVILDQLRNRPEYILDREKGDSLDSDKR